jgi:hypothetical protein
MNLPSFPLSSRLESLDSCKALVSYTAYDYKSARKIESEFDSSISNRDYVELPVLCLDADKQETKDHWVFSLSTYVSDKSPVQHILTQHDKKKRHFVVTHFVKPV